MAQRGDAAMTFVRSDGRAQWLQVADRWALPLVLGGWALFVILWPPAPLAMSTDDAYYYTRIARNVAAGQGATFDGVEPTNGFHPAWLLAMVPLCRFIGDADALMRSILVVQLGLVAVGARFLASAVGVPGTQFAIAIVFLSPYGCKVLVNGLESALAWALLCAALGAGKRVASAVTSSARQALDYGLLLGACIVARFNAALIALFALARPAVPMRGLLTHAVAATACALPLAAWFVWSLRATGHVVPVSAAIKLAHTGFAPIAFGVGVLATGATLVVSRWVNRTLIAQDATAEAWALRPLYGYILVQIVADAMVRGMPLPEIWTLVPHLTLGVITLALSLGALRLQPVRAAVAFGVYAAFVVITWIVRLDSRSWSLYEAARNCGTWVRKHTPDDATIAGWDCGIVAEYASRRHFVNLDGLANSWSFKQRCLDADALGTCLERDIRPDYIVQYVPSEWLQSDPDLQFDGVSLRAWHVVHHECVTFRSILSPWKLEPLTFLVLARSGDALTLDAVASDLCTHEVARRLR